MPIHASRRCYVCWHLDVFVRPSMLFEYAFLFFIFFDCELQLFRNKKNYKKTKKQTMSSVICNVSQYYYWLKRRKSNFFDTCRVSTRLCTLPSSSSDGMGRIRTRMGMLCTSEILPECILLLSCVVLPVVILRAWPILGTPDLLIQITICLSGLWYMDTSFRGCPTFYQGPTTTIS